MNSFRQKFNIGIPFWLEGVLAQRQANDQNVNALFMLGQRLLTQFGVHLNTETQLFSRPSL
jgi:hypothetical protein